MMRKQSQRTVCLMVIGLIMACAILVMPVSVVTSAMAATPATKAEEFYKGKVIKFVVPFKPGGGYDYYPRLISPFLEKYTGATVIVKNIPAAGGIYATNLVYRAKPDGLTIAIVQSVGTILSQLFKREGVRYDYTKFNWLGRTSYDKRTTMVAKNSPYHTLQDLIDAKSIKLGSSGKLSQGCIDNILLAHALGFESKKLTPIPRYGGSSEFTLALEQKEIDICGNGEGSAYMFSRGGIGRVLVVLARERSEYFPQIPTVYEQMKIPEDRRWPLDIDINMSELHRGLIMTPGVPSERVNFIRDAISKSLSNKELLAKAAKAKREIAPLSGAEVQKLIEEKLAKLTQEKINELNYIIMEKYY